MTIRQQAGVARRAVAVGGLLVALLGAGTVTVPTVVAAEPATAAAVAGRTVGETTSGNLGISGQCTWGAYEKFHEATGLWPIFDGNAADWNDTAPNHGWTVVLDAEPRAVVVFEPGVQGADATYGHVAWVDAVDYRLDGRWITITEMNAIGTGEWSQRTIKDVIGMSYILAP
jgi:surface antigen